MSLVIGMILDAIFGEPRWLWSRMPHPAILMGRLIGWFDIRFNKGSRRKMKGIVVVLVLVISSLLLGTILKALPFQIAEVLILAVLLAQRSLAQHVSAVADALRLSLSDGRRSVAMIVGRDTAVLDESGVARSAIESAAENLSDGVIAPIFWFAIGGLPGLLVYKITNTADSMIGYKTERHSEFGWAAARFDDLLNLIPARLTALLIWLTGPNPETPKYIFAEAPRHRSPNAGWPEAAMSYHLNVALSGPRSYEGRLTADPFVNPTGHKRLTADSIEAASITLWKVWGLALIAALIFALF